jgi:hypothetical protein
VDCTSPHEKVPARQQRAQRTDTCLSEETQPRERTIPEPILTHLTRYSFPEPTEFAISPGNAIKYGECACTPIVLFGISDECTKDDREWLQPHESLTDMQVTVNRQAAGYTVV